MLEYMRDEDAKQYEQSNPFLYQQTRVRQIVIGSCKLKVVDVKADKGAAFEFVPKVSLVGPEIYLNFYCCRPKILSLNVMFSRVQSLVAKRL